MKLTEIRRYRALQDLPIFDGVEAGDIIEVNYKNNLITVERKLDLKPIRYTHVPGMINFSAKSVFEEIFAELPEVGSWVKIFYKNFTDITWYKASGHPDSNHQLKDNFIIGELTDTCSYNDGYPCVELSLNLIGGKKATVKVDIRDLSERVQEAKKYWYVNDKGALVSTWAGLDRVADGWRSDTHNMYPDIQTAYTQVKLKYKYFTNEVDIKKIAKIVND